MCEKNVYLFLFKFQALLVANVNNFANLRLRVCFLQILEVDFPYLLIVCKIVDLMGNAFARYIYHISRSVLNVFL